MAPGLSEVGSLTRVSDTRVRAPTLLITKLHYFESARTTGLYYRGSDAIALDEVERVVY